MGLLGKRSSTAGSSPAATRSASIGASEYIMSCAKTGVKLPNRTSKTIVNVIERFHSHVVLPKLTLIKLTLTIDTIVSSTSVLLIAMCLQFGKVHGMSSRQIELNTFENASQILGFTTKANCVSKLFHRARRRLVGLLLRASSPAREPRHQRKADSFCPSRIQPLGFLEQALQFRQHAALVASLH